MVEQHSEDVVVHRESAFDHEEARREDDRRRHPFIDWRLNISHVLSLIGAIGAGLFAFLALGHEVELHYQELNGRIALLKSSIETVDSGLAGRVTALEEKANMRTAERQSADADIRDQIRELRNELTESRRLIAQHMSKDR